VIHRTLGGPETDRSGTHLVVVVQRGRKVQPIGISARAPGWQAEPPDQGFEFCPHDAGMHAPVERSLSKTAVGTRDDVFSRPTSGAILTIRSQTSSGCSTTLVAWLITPGISTLPGGSLTSRLKSHS
jgi:hypothetical protein